MGNTLAKGEITGMFHLLLYVPSSIFLPLKSSYNFISENKSFNIQIYDDKWSVNIVDYANELLFNEKEIKLKNYEFNLGNNSTVITSNGEPIIVAQFADDGFREVYQAPCTTVIVRFESNENDNNPEIALKGFKFFFKAYQIISEDAFALSADELFLVTNTTFKFFYKYLESELAMSAIERFEMVVVKRFELDKLGFSTYKLKNRFNSEYNKANDQLMKIYLNSRIKDDFILEALSNAQRQKTLYKNYKYALLECFFVIESVVYKFVEQKKIEKGISKNKLKDFTNRIGISYLINIEMPLLLEVNDEKSKRILDNIDQVRRLRNEVVHKNREVSVQEADLAIAAVNSLLSFLKIPKF